MADKYHSLKHDEDITGKQVLVPITVYVTGIATGGFGCKDGNSLGPGAVFLKDVELAYPVMKESRVNRGDVEGVLDNE